jgi:hypothetical protein
MCAQVLDGQQDSMALAASRVQTSNDQRSLHGFLRPTQAPPDQAPGPSACNSSGAQGAFCIMPFSQHQ